MFSGETIKASAALVTAEATEACVVFVAVFPVFAPLETFLLSSVLFAVFLYLVVFCILSVFFLNVATVLSN